MKNIEDAVEEAQRFIVKACLLQRRLKSNPNLYSCKESGALRRALSEMRK